MKKSVYILLVFLGVQLLSGIVGPMLLSWDTISQGKPVPSDFLQQHPSQMGWLLIVTDLLILAVLYAWNLLLPRLSLRRHVGAWPLALLCFLPAMLLANVMTEQLGLPDSMGMTFDSMKNNAVCVVAIAVLGPATEEMVFRRAMLGQLLSGGCRPAVALTVQAAIFAAIHANPAQMPGAFLLGLLLGWIFMRTGSILPGILAHVCNNSLALVAMNLAPDATIRDMAGSAWAFAALVVVATALALVFLLVFNRHTPQGYTLKSHSIDNETTV